MVSVVIDDQRAAARPVDLAELLQPPVDALKLRQRFLNGRIGDAELGGDGDRRERIQHIVPPRQIDG